MKTSDWEAKLRQRVAREREMAQKMEKGAALYSKGKSLRQAAAAVGVSNVGLWKFLRRNKLPIGPTNVAQRIEKDKMKEMLRLYQTETLSLTELAERFDFNKGTIRRILHGLGKMTRSPKEGRIARRIRNDTAFRPPIIELYKQGVPIKTIARQLHTSIRRVQRVAKEYLEITNLMNKAVRTKDVSPAGGLK